MSKERKHVLLQINTGITGSTGRIAQQIGELAIANGWDSWIACSGREKSVESQSHLIRIGSSFDSSIHALFTRLFDRHGLHSTMGTKRLVRKIKEIKPDIIHLHNIHGYYLNIPILFQYLAEANVPVVWTLHDCWAFTGHCVHFTDVDCFKWEVQEGKELQDYCNHCPKKRGYPSSFFVDRSGSNYFIKKQAFTGVKDMTLVPVSYWLGTVVKRSFLGCYPVRVIQNGIDINIFYPRPESGTSIREKYQIKGQFIILGVAKGWSEDVGYNEFIRLRSVLDDQYSIVMVGLTDKQISSLPPGIVGITHVWGGDELAKLYSTADVFFNGSYQETFGLVTAEAMACGTPVIVYNSTACPEIVDNERGRIIPVGGFKELVDAIYSLTCMTENKKLDMANECANYVRAHLDKNLKYLEYIQSYNSLVRN